MSYLYWLVFLVLVVMSCPAMVNADSQPKSEESHFEGEDDRKDLQSKLRNHPLFFGITMGLLAEIINSR